MTPEPLPLPTLSPVLRVVNAAEALGFYVAVYGAKERYRLTDPKSGRIAHAELQIGDSVLMLTQSSEPQPSFEGTPPPSVQLSLGVADVDAVVQAAVRSGSTILRAPANQFYGYRCANLRDPFGFEWMLSQRIENLTPAEMQERWGRSATYK
ncbi:MAG: VOC family protein [Verrucomicrobiales bacterium]|nr:VOC family protein [Verrucomicrobiales bacterium]